MTAATRFMLALIGLAAAGVLTWVAARSLYFGEAGRLHGRIAAIQAFLVDARNESAERPALDRRLRRFIDRTLGGDLETVDHRLRTRLNRLGERAGLAGLSVSTGEVRSLKSPAAAQFSRSAAQQPLRDEIDVVEVEGRLSGEGTLEQVLSLVHQLQVEPWLKIIRQVQLDPRDNGGRMLLNLSMSTVFLPGRAPDAEGAAEAIAPDPSGVAHLASLVSVNPFRVPPAPAAAPAAPPRATTFAYAQWHLTGVATGPEGDEAWLRNGTDGAMRILRPGDSLHEAQLVALSGDTARFRVGNREFFVVVGENLGHGSAPGQ
jgi:hypothetical protein